MLESGKFLATRSSLWNRLRLQLGVGLVVAVIAPWVVRVQLAQRPQDLVGLQISVLGTMLALILGYFSFRRLSRLPGVRAAYHIFPSFAVSYGIVLAIFFFLRLDYSRLQFLASFLLSICWYYIVYFRIQRQHRLRIGVVPFGDIGSLREVREVTWIVLSDPQADPRGLDAVVADLRADIPDEWERFLADSALAGTLIMHVKQMQESLTGRVAIEHLSENNLGSLIPGIIYAKVKRAGDVIGAAVVLPLLAPFLLIVMAAIRLDSGGPVLFRQQRMGYRGGTFTMFKFRSMHDRAMPEDDPRLAAVTHHDDLRVTRLGRFLRRYRVDELPQILNILKGEMSWIGPRPEAVPLSLWYEKELPFYRYRHIVRPGITGWAQVNQGHVAEVDDVLWKLHYDFYYIKNFSFWVDLLIVARTIRTIFTGFGAR
ncbi:MAG: polyprenyl glycosylphosphotransferase [Alphaproteobacteria bacterium]|nr:polyprenyl glycosylphosphotransferase [Alphaproteobacteria bacterium]